MIHSLIFNIRVLTSIFAILRVKFVSESKPSDFLTTRYANF